MSIKKFIILLLFSFTASTISKAQQLKATLSHYSTENDLVSNAVSHITQDKYGYLWIATWNGLSRFDGYNFYNYKLGAASGIPLLHNRILDLKVDHYQNIWMRMYDGRIFMLNRSTDNIVNVFEGVTGYENFKTYHPLTVTSKGDVLAAIDKTGIYKMAFDPKTNTIKRKFITTNKIRITSIVEGYKNDLWVATDEGIHRLGPNDESIDQEGIFPEEQIICMYSNGFNIYAGTYAGKIISFAYGQEPQILYETDRPISSVFIDSHNQLWFTTSQIGVSKLDLQTGQRKDYAQEITVPEYDVNGAFVTEVNGIVWINMNHGGFGYYNRENDVVEYFHNNPANPWDLSNTVTTYLALPEDVIFESTSRKGLEKLMIQKKTIERIKLFDSIEDDDKNEVRALFYDKQRNLFMVGNSKSDLFIIKGDNKIHITHDSNGNPLGRIYDINKDRMGNYWICSKGGGVFKMTYSDGNYRIISYRHDENNANSLSSNNAYCSVEDKHGNIWVATYDGGVNIMVKKSDGTFDFVNNKNGMKDYPQNSHHKVRSLTIDKEGSVWAGTTDGLIVMSYENNEAKISKATEQPEPSKRLQCNDIICLKCDENGTIWIGTNGGGLSHCTGKDENGFYAFETLESKDGLPSDEIKSLTFDNTGDVWFATDHIICSYDIQKKVLSTYSFQDGVDDTFCSERTALSTPDGNILIGTQNGYYFVDCKKLTTHSGSVLKLKITDFYIDDVLMSPSKNDTYSYYVPDSKQVTLPDHNSDFSIRFASLNYQLQHRVHYQYMLEGYDTEWRNSNKDRIARYSDLSGGNYTFKVKAFILESPDKYDIRTMEITVPPHFLLSAKAMWIYILISILLIICIVFIYKKRKERVSKLSTEELDAYEFSNLKKENHTFVKQQLAWLEENYSNSELKIEDLVAQSSLSRTSFYNELKSNTGLSPKEFILEFRLRKAMSFLKSSGMTISEIAYKTGFNDPVYFAKLFKQKTGMTPTNYREEQQPAKQQDDYVQIED